MRVNGKTIKGPRVETLVLPFGDNDEEFIVFKFRALTSKDDFETVMPRPKPRALKKPGDQIFYDTDAPEYRDALTNWAKLKLNWEFLQSISATDDLQWATVDMSKPETWDNWRKDMEEFFGTVEYTRIYGAYLRANMLDDSRLEEARARFLASQVLAQVTT